MAQNNDDGIPLGISRMLNLEYSNQQPEKPKQISPKKRQLKTSLKSSTNELSQSTDTYNPTMLNLEYSNQQPEKPKQISPKKRQLKTSLKSSTNGLSQSTDAYNPTNKLISRQFIESTLSKLCGYSVRIGSESCYQLAFVHKSVYRKDISPPLSVVQQYLDSTKQNGVPIPPPLPLGTYRPQPSGVASRPLVFTDTYEAMEFSGDGWVGAVVGQYVRTRFPCQSAGFYSKMKQHVVSKDGLSRISGHLGFGQFALLTPETEELISRNNPSLLEDMFEAFCDAVVEDQGVSMLRIMMKNIIESDTNGLDFRSAIINDNNYKDVFKRACQDQGWKRPLYVDLGDNGMVGLKREYNVGILLSPEALAAGIKVRKGVDKSNQQVQCIAMGSGATKKKAQQAAALNALHHLHTAIKIKQD